VIERELRLTQGEAHEVLVQRETRVSHRTS
jgi:hypothetical protein